MWDITYRDSNVFIAKSNVAILRTRLLETSDRSPDSTLFDNWEEKFDNEGNITELQFYTQIPRIEELEQIADLVRDDSWIEVYDDDEGDIFRYVFQNGVIDREYPTISWSRQYTNQYQIKSQSDSDLRIEKEMKWKLLSAMESSQLLLEKTVTSMAMSMIVISILMERWLSCQCVVLFCPQRQ